MDFFDIAFSSIMLPITFLTILVVSYWVLVTCGIVGIDLFDIDFDVDVDSDVGDASTGDTAGGTTSFSLLKFFHVGEVPIMILLSIFSFVWWFVTYIAAANFSETYTGIMAVMWVGPSLLVSLVVTKILLWPTSRFFRSFDGSKDSVVKILGRTVIVTTSEVTDTFGQAEVKIEGPPIILDVRCGKGDLFAKGDFARVVSHDSVNNTYLIGPISEEEADK